MIIKTIIIIIVIIIFLYGFKTNYKLAQNKKKIFHEINEFPDLKIIHDNWETIRDEMPQFNIDKLNNNLQRIRGVWDTDNNKDLLEMVNNKVDWISGWSKNWFHFPIYYLGKPIKNIENIMPQTYKILKNIPSIYVAGYSILMPETTLDWHVDETGESTNSLAVNLGLNSDNSFLYVEDKDKYIHTTKQKNGEMIIFDSNNRHKVINKSKSNIRVILYIDFKVNHNEGEIVKGEGLAKKMGYPTININLKRKMSCGVYTCETKYKNGILFVDKYNLGELHLLNFDQNINNDKYIYLSNINGINSNHGRGIIGTFCKGCE